MRVVADPESSSDLREIELRRHLQMMARYVERAKAGSCLTMILRSAGSDPAKALIGMKGALQRAGVRAKVILARLDPEEELRQLFASLSELAPLSRAPELIRWARDPRLLEAHEQVIYGDCHVLVGRRHAPRCRQTERLDPVRRGGTRSGAARPACLHRDVGGVNVRARAASDRRPHRPSLRRL